MDGFRQVERLSLNPGDAVYVETELFCLAILAGTVRGGAMRTTLYRDETPGARNIPLELVGAELLLHSPDRPVLVTGDRLTAAGTVGAKQRTLVAGKITGIFVYDKTV